MDSSTSTVKFTGVCFSPDGTTLFVNMQDYGTTFAITGPWEKAFPKKEETEQLVE